MSGFCKKICIVSLLFFLPAYALTAETYGLERTFPNRYPPLIGQGNSTAASASGIGSLFSNPAGFVYPETFGTDEKVGVYVGMQVWGNSYFLDFITPGLDVPYIEEGDQPPPPPDFEDWISNAIGDPTGLVANLISDIAGLADFGVTMMSAINFFLGSSDPALEGEANTIFNIIGDWSGSYLRGVIGSSVYALNDGQFSLGGALTLGYVNHGIGLGFRVGLTADNYYPYENIFSALIEYTAVGGYARTFHVGEFALTPGVDVRPFLQYGVSISEDFVSNFLNILLDPSFSLEGVDSLLSAMNSGIEFLYGWGVGVDLGFTVEYKSFTVGLQVRDVYTPVFYQRTGLIHGMYDFFAQDGFITELSHPTSDVEHSIIPTEISIGFMYDIPFKKEDKFDMRIHMQFSDPFNLTGHLNSDHLHNFFQVFDMGIDLYMVSIFDFSMGISDGLFAVGLGIDLFIFEIHAAVYDIAVGIPGTSHSRTKVALEAGISF